MSENLIELGKKTAAEKAVEENVKKNMILGIGSGSTVVYAVKKIAEMNKDNDLNLKCIPTSFQSYQLIVENGLKFQFRFFNPQAIFSVNQRENESC